MRGFVERYAWKMWGGNAGALGALLGLVLLPLSAVWRVVAALRGREKPAERSGGCAVVSVGNLAVGGTGKTPIASWVAHALQSLDRRPAIVVHPVAADEAELHRRWTPGVPVVADGDRGRGAERACADGADVVVLDDGFQSRSVARDLDVVLLAVEDRFPGSVLPRGPYREPASAVRRADVVILTRRSASVALARDLEAKVLGLLAGSQRGQEGHSAARVGSVVASVCLAPGRVERLTAEWAPRARDAQGFARVDVGAKRPDGGAKGPTEALDGPVALTAIARADGFLRSVAAVSAGQVGLIALPDHHRFTVHDVRQSREKAGTRPIVVTEKDAVKLTPFVEALGEAWVLIQEVEWDWGEVDVRSRLAEVASCDTTTPTPTSVPVLPQ